MAAEYVIDVQGFKAASNVFIFKEVAIIRVQEDAMPSIFLFEPPFHWSDLPLNKKIENRWLSLNYHGLLWQSGHIPYEELENTLRDSLDTGARIYIKGLEKARWLSQILRTHEIINVEDMGCPAFAHLPVDLLIFCRLHVETSCLIQCAIHNALKIRRWLLEQKRKENKYK